MAGDKILPADKISFSHDNGAGISVSTKLGATLFGNVKQMVGTSSCYKSVCCTLTVFTVRAWILKLPLFRASVCMTFVFYALYSCVMCLSPVVTHYRNDTKSFFFFFFTLQKMALLSRRRSTKSCWPQTDLTSPGVIHTWTRPSQ